MNENIKKYLSIVHPAQGTKEELRAFVESLGAEDYKEMQDFWYYEDQTKKAFNEALERKHVLNWLWNAYTQPQRIRDNTFPPFSSREQFEKIVEQVKDEPQFCLECKKEVKGETLCSCKWAAQYLAEGKTFKELKNQYEEYRQKYLALKA